MSSIQKTPISYFTTILMAEKILKIIPENTHDFEKFVDLEKLNEKMNQMGSQIIGHKFFIYDSFGNRMIEDDFLKIHYCVAYKRS